MPTILRIGPYRFFFNSREEPRLHVHVASPAGVAKYWLEPEIELANAYNLKSKELGKLEALVREHADEFKAAWQRHFGQ
jgi:hypothetical protein